MCPMMHANSAIVFSIPVIWAQKTQVAKRGSELKTWLPPSGGTCSVYCCLDPSIDDLPHSYHTDLNMDTVVTAVRDLFAYVTGIKPKFRAHGGSNAENLALQNIQVDSMVIMECSISHCYLRRDFVWSLPTCSRSCFHG